MIDPNNVNEGNLQLMLLQKRLNDHIGEFHKRCESEDVRWSLFMVNQESNTNSIRELVASNKELSDSTRDVVDVWKAADGTMKTLSAVGKFVKWLSGFAVVGVAIKWIAEHLN